MGWLQKGNQSSHLSPGGEGLQAELSPVARGALTPAGTVSLQTLHSATRNQLPG